MFLCFMFLTFVGCAMEGGDDEEGGVGTSLLNSAVVLSRPADYFEKDYVGENASVYYYNKYAKEILEQLYDAYSNADYEKDGVSMFTGNSKYLYDAIRYSVKSVRNTYNSSNALTQQEVVIDLNNGWNWGVPEKLDIVLRNNGSNVTVVDDFTNHTKTYTYSAGFFTSNSDWSDILTDKVAYNKYYYHTNSSTGDAVGKYDGTNLQYYYSPSHNEDGLSGVMNYYQDALEYAIYMISLGYNRADQPGFF
ncbi:MAG: hypothetical protein K2K31_02790, partial [Clostridia bacterium]|nr:hypothetical protein [Clostridia bacterium]